MAVAGDLIPGCHGTAIARLFKGPPSSSRPSSNSYHLSHSLTNPPVVAERPEMVIFFFSGNHDRRLCLVHSNATRASPSPLSSPTASCSTHESVPTLDFDQDSPQAKAPSHPTPPSAGKLVAGDSVHVGDLGGYPRVRLDPLSTPMSSDLQGTPPFAGKSSPELRRCSVGGGRRARGLVKPDQWARRAHRQ